MKEPVRRTKHPWIVGACVVGIGALYFALLGTSDFPEPSTGITYDVATYAKLDDVETQFEEVGTIDPAMDDPQAMSIAPDGRLVVAGANTVAIFDTNDNEIERHAVEGTAKCVTVAEDNSFYLGFSDHVKVLEADGTLRASWTPLDSRAYVTSIAVLGDDVFVADAGNRVVLRYNRDGELLGRIGEKNEESDIPGIEVPSPYLDLAINGDGDLWVVNPGRLGLERYRPDGSIVTSWYRPTLKLEGFSGCCNPTHIAFDSAGRLVTAEKGLVRVKKYEVTLGEFEELVAGSKLFPREQSLRDLVVDTQDRILVLDPRTDTIRVFDQKDDYHGETRQSA